jgi:hypothetical protein
MGRIIILAQFLFIYRLKLNYSTTSKNEQSEYMVLQSCREIKSVTSMKEKYSNSKPLSRE